jgi:hypothetical protein
MSALEVTMPADKPDHTDAELILKLYDLRREAVMRKARNDLFGKFHPKSFKDLQAVQKRTHPLNTAYRMVSSYWEMAAGFVKHGILNADLFAENCGEGLFLYAKVEPYVEELRRGYSPTAYQNMEFVLKRSAEALRRLEIVRKRLQAMGK